MPRNIGSELILCKTCIKGYDPHEEKKFCKYAPLTFCSDYKPRCENYETLNGIECVNFSEEVYTIGTSRYCRHFERDIYNLKDKGCFHRGTYSDEVQQEGSPSLARSEEDT